MRRGKYSSKFKPWGETMAYKIFPETYDGDKIRITFTDYEEKRVFESVVNKLQRTIAQSDTRDALIENFEFDTTLQMQVTRDYLSDVMAVVGLRVFNIYGKQESTIYPLPARL